MKTAEEIQICYQEGLSLRRTGVHWEKRGVIFDTKWHFEEGTEIEFTVELGPVRRNCTGIVVGCNPHPCVEGLFETSLYFVDEPCQEMAKIWAKKMRSQPLEERAM
jgi:hypothetical protein